MNRWGVILALSFVSLILFAPRPASADRATFDAAFFKPAVGRNTYLMLHGTDTLRKLQFDVGELFSYGYRPLEIRESGSRVRGVIDHLLVADFVAAIGALDWLQFGLDFPVVPFERFREPLATPVPALARRFGIGDLRLEGKARFLDACEKRVGLAVIPFITIPTGKDSYYIGDPGFTGGAKVAVDGRVHEMVGLTMNVGYQGGRNVNVRNVEFQHRLLLGGGAQLNLKYGIDAFTEFNAVAAFNKLFHDRDMNPAEAMVGARWDIKETGVSLHGAAGTCLVCGVKGARVRTVIGAKYRFMTPKYRNLEGKATKHCRTHFVRKMSIAELQELKTNCPGSPADFNPEVHDASCPKYYELREVAGLVLKCPERADQFDPAVHDAACPKVFELRGMFSPGEVQNIYDLAIAEMTILCPDDPTNFNAQLHDAACPKFYDLREALSSTDQMKIVTLAGVEEAKLAGITEGEIKTEPVYFDFGRASLRPDARKAVDEAIAIINRTVWVRKVRVGGHADAIGSEEANERLSRLRAQTVIRYMRAHGTRGDVELVPIAYGEYRPAASNTTEIGRALNRRVVFTIVGTRHEPYTPSTSMLPEAFPISSPELPSEPAPQLEPEPEYVSPPQPEPERAPEPEPAVQPERATETAPEAEVEKKMPKRSRRWNM